MVSYFRDRFITLRLHRIHGCRNTNQWKLNEVYPAKKILDTIRERYHFTPVHPNCGEASPDIATQIFP